MKSTMKAVQISGYARPKPGKDRWTSAACNIRDVITVEENVKPPKFKSGKKMMILRTLTSAVDPGSWRMVNGSIDLIRHPKSFPYIPGHDVCGYVEKCDPDSGFKVGDLVVSTSTKEPLSLAMAEYAEVQANSSALVPDGVSPEEAVALASAGHHALGNVKAANIKEGDRVLVLGGGGGIGMLLLQLIKRAGASFIVLTSTHWKVEDVSKFGVNKVVNYNEEKWWEKKEFMENKFDKIFDCGEGKIAWKRCKKVLKSSSNGGRFCSVTLDNPELHIHNIFQTGPIFRQLLFRHFWVKMFSNLPGYNGPSVVEATRERLNEILEICQKKEIEVVFDPVKPLPFTTEGVCKAFEMMGSRHAHGKIVIRFAES